MTLFLAGDVMTGRGVDQILPHPSDPELRESYLRSATDYVKLAVRESGPVHSPVEPVYVWGDALPVLERERPAASIVNLETSVTVSSDFWPGKGVHYRMHPDNVDCLRAARIDVCALANNHLLDFGRSGLRETLEVLEGAGIQWAGAGRDREEARRPARVTLHGGASLWVCSFGSASSGIPRAWGAEPSRSGVDLLDDLSPKTADEITARIRAIKRPGDISVASVHWGSNWGYEIFPDQIAFARRLIDGGVDVVHGHSSHHLRSIEVYRGKLILYGCGDLVTDYEGIQGHDAWRGDLGAMYLSTVSPADGSLMSLRLFPTQMRRLRLTRASPADTRWLTGVLNQISEPFGSHFDEEDGVIELRLRSSADRAAPSRP